MKMRLGGFLALALLLISITFYTFNGSALGATIETPPISVTTELPLYENGDRVVINGKIRDYDPDADSGKGLTLIIKSPDNNIVAIGQITPSSDGSFAYSKIVAGGPLWKLNGDYIIEFHFGSLKGSTKVVYTGGTFEVPPPEKAICTPNQNLIDGKCIDKAPKPVKEPEPVKEPGTIKEPEPPVCGKGTELVNGICKPIKVVEPGKPGGGCLIATAAYGSELAPQVQFLREIRDNTLLSTSSGMAFMTGFNQLYYSFSPTIADLEREHPLFQETVRALITPMLSSLSIMTLAEDGSEAQVLGLGISIIVLNLGMYIAAPVVVGLKVHKHLKSRKQFTLL
ncbi:MAG: hypothetical protein HW410_530 [Nitrosarchaeum sp.]|nr:hypothetical protein [Nitrosarchaeum sp.]